MPYPKFREVIAERNRLKAEMDALSKRVTDEYEPLKAKLTPLEQQVAELSRSREEFETLMWALERNPAIRDELYRSLGTTPPPGTEPARRPALRPPGRTEPATAALPPDVQKTLDESKALITEMRANSARELQQANQARFDAHVNTIIDHFLSERKYDGSLELYPGTTLRDDVLGFLRQNAEHLDGGGTLEDVPPLLNRWYARNEALRAFWLKDYLPAKASDKTLPAALPGGQPPLEISDKPLAISQPGFKDQVKEAMRAAGFGGA